MTSQSDDLRLIKEYVEHGSDAAFAALVERHIGLVYSTAMRQVRDEALAKDVTQTTFIILTKKARTFDDGTILSGWLYRTAQYASGRALRTEHRRREREKEAMDMHLNPTESTWDKLAPLLDQAMARLSATDRDAILLRYFENKTSREVGLSLGVNESTAQKRVVRAVEKLRSFCTKRGVILPAAVLTAVISANSVQAAPAGLSVSTMAAASGMAGSASTAALVKGTLKLLTWAKYKFAITLGMGLLTASTGLVVVEQSDFFAPKYQGKPVADWLVQIDDNTQENPYMLPWRNLQADITNESANQAMRGLGAKALPALLCELAREDSTADRWFHHFAPSPEIQRHRAALAFEVLGPDAKPALAQLTKLFHQAQNPKEAARALAAIGPEGWEILDRAMTNDDACKFCGIWALGTHRAAAPGTVEKLKKLLERDAFDSITGLSAWALSEIGQDREEVISLLIKDLDSRRSDTRWSCALALGHFGRDAQSAVPALVAHLKDIDPNVRHDLAQALEEIDPAEAARQGVAGALATEHKPKTWFQP